MKSMFLAVAAVLALGVSAQAADLSSSDLAQCGLSAMNPMSDAQGMQVRAKFILVKTGNIQANVAVFSNQAPEVLNQTNNTGGSTKTVITNRAIVVVGNRIGGGGGGYTRN